MEKFYSGSVVETKKIATKFAKSLKPGDIVLLAGDLGAGKTLFTKSVVEAFGIKDDVVSPTFTIMNEYGNGRIYHFDLYRLNSYEEFEATGAMEQMFSGAISMVEWPEVIGFECFPKEAIVVKILKKSDKERVIEIGRNE